MSAAAPAIDLAEIVAVPAAMDRDGIHAALAPAGARRPRRIERELDALQPVIEALARPRLALRALAPDALLEALGRPRGLTRHLAAAHAAAAVIGTAGRELEGWIAGERDPLRRHLAGAMATVLARRCLAHAVAVVRRRHPGTGVAARSPGNAGLPLALQAPLVALLPLAALGVAFDHASLALTPLASVTAVIAAGAYAAEPTGCAACPRPACGLRQHAFVHAHAD